MSDARCSDQTGSPFSTDRLGLGHDLFHFGAEPFDDVIAVESIEVFRRDRLANRDGKTGPIVGQDQWIEPRPFLSSGPGLVGTRDPDRDHGDFRLADQQRDSRHEWLKFAIKGPMPFGKEQDDLTSPKCLKNRANAIQPDPFLIDRDRTVEFNQPSKDSIFEQRFSGQIRESAGRSQPDEWRIERRLMVGHQQYRSLMRQVSSAGGSEAHEQRRQE